MNRVTRRASLLSGLLLLAAGSATAGTDDLQVTVTASSGIPALVTDGDGTADDGIATKGVVFVDFTVHGTAFQAGAAVGTVSFAFASVAGGAGTAIYPVSLSVASNGDPSVEVSGAVSAASVMAPGSVPKAIPDALSLPVSVTSDEARVEGLAVCVDGVPPLPLVHTISFSNSSSGRNKLGNGPNVKVRLTLDCQEDEVVFCTAGQGCFGQPGGQPGGDIALCNDPLAGWLTLNEAAVLPLTVGGTHTLNDVATMAGACSSAAYPGPASDGQGTGFEFQTLCSQDGLIAYLPAGSTPATFRTDRGSNREVSSASDMMFSDRQGSGSRGSGSGTLAGQALALKLGFALSATGNGPFVPAAPGSCVDAGGGAFRCADTTANAGADCSASGAPDDSLCFDRVAFVPSALAEYELPLEMCTQLSGADRRLEDAGCSAESDDECHSFVLPACVVGLSVGQLLTAAEEVLSGGTSSVCGGDSSTLSDAIDLVNQAFDGCGKVVTCPDLGEGFSLPVDPDDESLSQPGEGTTVNFSAR
jgi:hypothetical protein